MSRRQRSERLGLLAALLAGAWIAFVVALEVVGAVMPDWLSWTAPAAGELPASGPPARQSDGCVNMSNGIQVCDGPMPSRR